MEIVEAIVAATIEFAHPDISTNEIAERAGVGVASLYRYFPNRGAIFAEISRRLHRQAILELRDVFGTPGLTVEEAVSRCCSVIVGGSEVSRELRECLNLLVPSSWSHDSAKEMFEEVLELITSWLQANLPDPPEDLADRVFCIVGSARGVVVLAMISGDLAPTNEQLIGMLTRQTLAGLTKK